MASLASTRSLTVPFLDLTPVNAAVKDDVLAAVSGLIDRNEFGSGAAVQAFEDEFAEYCESAHAVGLASGLDALRLALLALGIGRGDEVIVPANTFVATFEAVSQTAARPVVVDVSEDDDNIDVAAAEAAVTKRTRAILPVHLYGQMADVVALEALASARGLTLVEDACQAHGARRDGIRAGSAGRAAAFSFYPAKNLGAMGDAGALVTDDAELAERVRALREHGQRAKYRHDFEGFTSRLDALQAAVLSAKLPHLDSWNQNRQDAASTYLAELDGLGDLRLPPVARGSIPVWHLFVVQDRVAGPAAGVPEPPGDSDRAPLSRGAPPLACVSLAGLRGRLVSGRGGGLEGRPLPTALPGHDGGAPGHGDRRDQGVLRAWLSRPSTMRPFG